MTSFCTCCHKALGPVRIGTWCEQCALGALDDVRRLQSLTPAQLVLLSDIFTTVGAFALVRAMVGALPFSEV